MKKKITGLFLGTIMATLSTFIIHANEYDDVVTVGSFRTGTYQQQTSNIANNAYPMENGGMNSSNSINSNNSMNGNDVNNANGSNNINNNNINSNGIYSNRGNNRDNNKGRINVNNDTYIIQDGDDLWLIMGHIKAKLDVLIYTDPKNNNSKVSENEKNTLSIPIIQNAR